MPTQRDNDADLAAVREAVASRTRHSGMSLARSWGTVVARRAGVEQAPRRRSIRALVPLAAAATVATVALGSVVLLGPRWDGLGFLAIEPGSPNDTVSYFPNLDPPSEAAVAALHALAAAAERSESTTVEDGQLVYVRSEGWATSYLVTTLNEPVRGTVVPQNREGWFDPEGMAPVLIRQGGEILHDSRGSEPGAVDLPPGPYAPTPEWLAGLPTDPDRLRTELRAILKDDQTWSTDHAVWTAMEQLYATAELLIPPPVRAALLRAFTGLRGLTMVEVDIDGRQLVGIRHVERASGDEILFDPRTGRAVGRRSVSPPGNERVIRPTSGPAVEPTTPAAGITYQSLWTQAIVDNVGEVPR